MTDAVERGEATRQFNRLAGLALVASVAAHAWQFAIGPRPLALFVCNASIIIGLALAAVRARRQSAGEFNSSVAAETIVAFGVLALILGLVTAIGPLLGAAGANLRFDAGTLTAIGAPFAQGLAAAGLAPVVAVLVRTAAAADEQGDDPTGETEALSDAVARLTDELDAARLAAGALNRALSDAAAETARIAPAIATQLEGVVNTAAGIGPAMANSIAAMRAELDGAGSGLADELGRAGQGVAAALDDCGARVAAMGGAAQAGTSEIATLTTSLGQLTRNADESAALLEALNTLTASVERFVARRVPA